ncbi:glycosyltransferase, partial [uncultured Mucilaginibacter sp.]|uniref:glycosyltransferase n=1 Tax=uncultured Mucilaginibacter sp. TaxID=797541 RepID=UPI0025D661E2
AKETSFTGESVLDEIYPNELLISVVCVTLNAAGTLPDLINSIREQKTILMEFVVVDGGSKDDTIEILKANEDIVDAWISRADCGIYDAMNSSLNFIRGKWVIFLGADDLLLNGFNEMLALLKDSNTIYYGNLMYYGRKFAKKYDDYYLTKLNICQQAIFYPRSVFAKYNFNLKYRVYADYHLNLRCWADPQFNFFHAEHLISSFSDGGFSSYEKDFVFEQERDMLFKTYLKKSSYYRYVNRTRGFWVLLLSLFQPG